MLFPAWGLGLAFPGPRNEGSGFLSRTLTVENYRQLELVMERQKMSREQLTLILKARGSAPSRGYATVVA